MLCKLLLGLFLVSSQMLFSTVLHYDVQVSDNKALEWICTDLKPFNELVVCWNAERPVIGEYEVYLRVKTDVWTEDLLYASWGAKEQRTFATAAKNLIVRTNEDILEILGGKEATAFCVTISAKNGSSLEGLWALHASTCSIEAFKQVVQNDNNWKGTLSVFVDVLGRSQLALDHPRCNDLCSPTSTSAVVSYLADKTIFAPDFAAKVWDAGFDIYGNWIFNVAQSASFLGKPWKCYMARYNSFEEIYTNLKKGIPTVVSVRGQLPRAIHPYAKGHLIAVIGYDKDDDCILCMDPGYPRDQDTLVRYPREDFLRACANRGYIAYFFDKPSSCFDIAN